MRTHTAGAQTPSNPGEPAPARPGRGYALLLAAHVVFVIYGSLVPLDFHSVPLARAWEQYRNIPMLSLGVVSRSDFVANILLFIPLTFLGMGAATRENTRRLRWLAAVALMVFATLLSLALEFTQIFFPPRTVSQNDIVAEFFGAAIGIACWYLFGSRVTNWARSLWRERAHGRLAVKILTGYLVAFVLYNLLPFDLTISPVEVYHKLKQGRVNLLPFADVGDMGPYGVVATVAGMIPIGFLVGVASSRRRSALAWAAVAGVFLAGMIEFLQLFVYSRFTSSTDVIFGAAGAVLGSWLARRVGPAARRPLSQSAFWRLSGTWLKLGLLVVWFGSMVWMRWQPFAFQWPHEGLLRYAWDALRIPFFHQYYTTEYEAGSQFVRELILFWLLGTLLRSLTGGLRRGPRAFACGAMVAIAFVLEAGQLLTPDRVPDATTLGLNILGGLLGIASYPHFVRIFVDTPAPTPEGASAES